MDGKSRPHGFHGNACPRGTVFSEPAASVEVALDRSLEPIRAKCSDVDAGGAVENALGDQPPGDWSESEAHHRVSSRNE